MNNIRAWIIPFTVAALTAAAAICYGTGLSEEVVRAYIRLTAGSSLLLFALAWSASSLNTLLPGDAWRSVLRGRRRIGIAFAISHSFHLAAIWVLMFPVLGGDTSEADFLTGGAIYSVIYLMALTSNDLSVRMLGAKTWKRLHWAGGYIIWIAFTVSYVGKVFEFGAPQHYLFSALCLALPALRLAAFLSRRQATVPDTA